MTPRRAVVFDFDGTLVDTMGGFAEIASDVISRLFGVDRAEARRRYIETSGLPFCQQLDILFPGDARNDGAAAEFEARKLEGFFAEAFTEEARRTVALLREKGYLVVVSSNNYQDLVDRFVARDSAVAFDLVLGARQGFYKGKDHFDHISRVLGICSENIVFVGDSLKDAERAISNDVRFVGKIGTFAPSDFQARFPGVPTVARLSDLVRLLP